METSLFRSVAEEYNAELHKLVPAIQQETIDRAQHILSMTEARHTIEDDLERSLVSWLHDFIVVAYPISLKRAARSYLHTQIKDHPDGLLLEHQLDGIIENCLGQPLTLAVTDPRIPVTSPLLKPTLVGTGTAASASFVLAQLSKGLLLYLGSAAILVTCGVISWKVFQVELIRARRDLEVQALAFVERFCAVMEIYILETAVAVDRATIQYVQEQLVPHLP